MTTLNVPPLGHPCPSCAGTLYGHFPLDGMEAGDNVPCPTCREPNLKHARMNGLYICPECNYTDCMPVLDHNRHPQPERPAVAKLRDHLAYLVNDRKHLQDELDRLTERATEHADAVDALNVQIADIEAVIRLAGGTV